jgi:hypothetical protein
VRPEIVRPPPPLAVMRDTRLVSAPLCAPVFQVVGVAQALAAAQRRIRCALCRIGVRRATEGPPAIQEEVAMEEGAGVAITVAAALMVLRAEEDRATRPTASATPAPGVVTAKRQ